MQDSGNNLFIICTCLSFILESGFGMDFVIPKLHNFK